MRTPPRHRKGTPTGGQFAASERTAAAVSLDVSAGEDGETLVRRFACETHDGPGECTPECTSLVAGMSGDGGLAEDPTGTSYPEPRPYDTYEYDEAARASICVIHVPEGEVLVETLTKGQWVYVDGEPRRVDTARSGRRGEILVDFEGFDKEPDGSPVAFFTRTFDSGRTLDLVEPEDVPDA